MEQSILKSTKKLLNVSPDDTTFDLDIITHINNAFSNLHDMGIGPKDGFVIEGEDEAWTDFLEDDQIKLSKVKTVVYIRTRLIFDPSTSGFLLTALEGQLREAEWRLSTNREETEWVDPTPPVVPEDPEIGFGL
jgi:hypothetical protein